MHQQSSSLGLGGVATCHCHEKYRYYHATYETQFYRKMTRRRGVITRRSDTSGSQFACLFSCTRFFSLSLGIHFPRPRLCCSIPMYHGNYHGHVTRILRPARPPLTLTVLTSARSRFTSLSASHFSVLQNRARSVMPRLPR